MRRPLFIGTLLAIAACGGAADIVTPPKKPAPDPYLTVRVRDLLDTTSAAGKSHWHIYVLLTGPYTNQNGVGLLGDISLQDIRLGHGGPLCAIVGADSVGQRLVSVLAVADTTTSNLTPEATADDIVNAWYAGNHTLPAGWAALFNVPADAWLSQQYLNGHGLTRDDPIKWGLDWTGSGIASFYERDAADTTACNRG